MRYPGSITRVTYVSVSSLYEKLAANLQDVVAFLHKVGGDAGSFLPTTTKYVQIGSFESDLRSQQHPRYVNEEKYQQFNSTSGISIIHPFSY